MGGCTLVSFWLVALLLVSLWPVLLWLMSLWQGTLWLVSLWLHCLYDQCKLHRRCSPQRSSIEGK